MRTVLEREHCSFFKWIIKRGEQGVRAGRIGLGIN